MIASPWLFRCAGLAFAVLCLGLLPARLTALDASHNPATDISDTEIEEKYVTEVQERAAEYRLKHSRFTPDEAYNRAGAAYAAQAREMLATGKSQPLESGWHWAAPQWWFVSPSKARRAQWLAEDGFAAFPFCQAAGALLGASVLAHAERGDIGGVHEQLFNLWFYLPDYDGMPAVMNAAIDAAEKTQDFNAAVNLEASDPREVISITGESGLSQVNKLFRFLVLHGDRETVAPRAAIGLARALLRGNDKDLLFLARREYEHFGETYPTHPLVFTALCERALCYLVSYRGDQYDVGVLITAASIIDQAEIESRGDQAKAKQIEAYRKRIRAWHQDRDLSVARWYRHRVIFGLSWLMCPRDSGPTWERAARYFYREVIRRDSGSDQGRIAARELAELPLPAADELGAPKPATP